MDSLEETTYQDDVSDGYDQPFEESYTEDSEVYSDEPSYLVKVSGEEMEVPLSELVNGYSRQQDYTRKTQELAAERERLGQAERLVRAFDTDPVRTIQALQEAYGLDSGTTTEEELDEYLDPEEARLRQIETFMRTQQQRELSAVIEGKFAALETQVGQPIDRDELADFMVQNGIRDFEIAYDAMSARSARAGRGNADRQAQQGKAQLPPVSRGHGVSTGSITPGRPAPASIREAFQSARNQLGM